MHARLLGGLLALCASCGPANQVQAGGWTATRVEATDTFGLPISYDAIHAVTDDDVWVVGGALLHYDGRSWSTRDPLPGIGLRALSSTAADDVWAVGIAGQRYHYDGVKWSKDPAPCAVCEGSGSVGLWSVWAVARDDVWAVGRRQDGKVSYVIHYDGHSWEPVSHDFGSRPLAVSGNGPRDVWVVGVGSNSHFDGDRWTRYPTTNSFTALARGTDGQMWFAGARNTIGRWDGANLGAELGVLASEGPESFVAVWADDTRRWVASTERVLVDDGREWSEAADRSLFDSLSPPRFHDGGLRSFTGGARRVFAITDYTILEHSK